MTFSQSWKTNPIQSQFKPNTNPILSAVGGLQMNVSTILTKDYGRNDIFAVLENKANSNPKQTQSNPIVQEVIESYSISNRRLWAASSSANLLKMSFRSGSENIEAIVAYSLWELSSFLMAKTSSSR
jgi:hypothetical protein